MTDNRRRKTAQKNKRKFWDILVFVDLPVIPDLLLDIFFFSFRFSLNPYFFAISYEP